MFSPFPLVHAALHTPEWGLLKPLRLVGISSPPRQHQELSRILLHSWLQLSITRNKQTTLRKCLWFFPSSGHPFKGAQATQQSLSIFSVWQIYQPRIFWHNNLKESGLSFGSSRPLQHPRVSSWDFQVFCELIRMFSSVTDPQGQFDVGTVVCSYGSLFFF